MPTVRGVRQLVDSPGLDDKPQWSPDGSRIGFATARSGSPQLLAVDPETGEEETRSFRRVSGLNSGLVLGWVAGGIPTL